MTGFYDLKMALPGKKGEFTFDQLKGKVVLIVNVASQCGFTPQYKGLESLNKKYTDRGVVLLGFPSNQFGGQEPGTDEEIASFCEINHGVTFPLMKKSDVNGNDTNEVYQWLKKEKSGLLGMSRIKWNFEKFLIDQNGKVVNRWASTTTPATIDAEIEKLLAKAPAVEAEPSTSTSTAEAPAPMATQLAYVNGAPLSPAATEYHDPMNATEDRPNISIHEPTPVYEKNPAFPKAHPYGKLDRTASPAAGSTNSKRVSIADDNVILGQGSGADVKRSGTWARGAGTSGLREDGNTGHSRKPSLAERAQDAVQHIPVEKQEALTKAEKKDAKRLSKIIVAEGKAEDKSLKSALKELSSLQAAQKKASAAETAATHAQSKANREQQRASSAYLEAKTRHERAHANLTVCQERLALAKEQAERTTVMVRQQAEEVDAMRERKATDDREREVKLANLKAGIMSPS